MDLKYLLVVLLLAFLYSFFQFYLDGSKSEFDDNFAAGYFGMSLLFLLAGRPWIEIVDLINLAPIKKGQKLLFVVFINSLNLFYVIAVFFLVLTLIRMTDDSVPLSEPSHEFLVEYILLFVFMMISLMTTCYSFRRFSLVFGNMPKAILSACVIALFIVFFNVLPSYLYVSVVGSAVFSFLIFTSFSELKIIKFKISRFLLIYTLIFTSLSFGKYIDQRNKRIILNERDFNKYVFELGDSFLSNDDRKLAISSLIVSDLSKYEFIKVCQSFFSKKNRATYKYRYLDKYDCLLPNLKMMNGVLSSKSSIEALLTAFASFDLSHLSEFELTILLDQLSIHFERGQLASPHGSVLSDLINFLETRHWELRELLNLNLSKNKYVRLVSVLLLTEFYKESLSDAEFDEKLDFIEGEIKGFDEKGDTLISSLLLELSSTYLCSKSPNEALVNFKTKFKTCLKYTKAFYVSRTYCEYNTCDIYLKNEYFYYLNAEND